MTEQIIYDESLGEFKKEPDINAWNGKWQTNDNYSVDISISPQGEAKNSIKFVKPFLHHFEQNEIKLKKNLAEKLIKLCNEDWNVENPLTETELAQRISLQGINISVNEENQVSAEVFYNDDDIFWGHGISFFMESNGQISEPNLAG
jgi:hypothetical protein